MRHIADFDFEDSNFGTFWNHLIRDFSGFQWCVAAERMLEDAREIPLGYRDIGITPHDDPTN